MEAFSRVMSIVVATIMFFPLLFMQRFRMESESRNETIEKEIKSVCDRVRKNREITSTDLFKMQELAALYGGKLQICVGTKRETLLPEDSTIYSYTDKIYLDDIQEIIANEGRLILLVGDSLSVSVTREASGGNKNFLFGNFEKNAVSTGGVV